AAMRCLQGACALQAAACPSGLRWDATAGALAGQCVAPLGSPDMSVNPSVDMAGGDMPGARSDMPGTQAPDMTVTCSNGVRDGAETDVDCGTACPNKCAICQGRLFGTEC